MSLWVHTLLRMFIHGDCWVQAKLPPTAEEAINDLLAAVCSRYDPVVTSQLRVSGVASLQTAGFASIADKCTLLRAAIRCVEWRWSVANVRR